MTTPPPLLGHDDLRAHLAEAARNDRLHHAYLFEGPEGVGKGTIALWLAQLATCEAEAPARPCGQCPTCRQVAQHNHPDVIWVEGDAKGTIPVAAIREVVRQAGYHRYSARRRVIIVDPAEGMNPAAANALLKTLEEPPEGTGFLLLAKHAQALLPTIVSRCQRLRFRPVELDTLTGWLADQGHEHPELVAAMAEGCPGRALRLAGGALAQRTARREAVLRAISGNLKGLFDVSVGLTKGSRADWTTEVDATLEVVEELLRDATVHGSGSSLPLLHGDAEDVVAAWSQALWPDGIAVCSEALARTREQLRRNVSGKNALDALWARLATELGRARTVGRPTEG